MTLKVDPFFVKARYHLAETLVVLQRWEEASRHLDIVLSKGAPQDSYYNLKGFVLLWQNRPEEALPYFRKALSISPGKSHLYVNMGVTLSRIGSTLNAEWFLNQARRFSTKNTIALFCQIENSLRAENAAKVERYSQEILNVLSMKEVQENLKLAPNRRDLPPIAFDIIGPVIQEAIAESIKHLAFR